MTTFVLDLSVATKWALPEAGHQKALALRDDILKGIHQAVAPVIFCPMKPKLTLRDLFRLVLVMGTAAGWWVERSRLKSRMHDLSECLLRLPDVPTIEPEGSETGSRSGWKVQMRNWSS